MNIETDEIQNLGEAIIEDLKESSDTDLESFDQYVQKVRSKMHDNTDVFLDRFAKGYQVLMEELKHVEKGS